MSSSKRQDDVKARYNQDVADGVTADTSDAVVRNGDGPVGFDCRSVTVTINVEEVNEGPDISRTGDTAGTDTLATPASGGEFVVKTPEEVRLTLDGYHRCDRPSLSGLPVFDWDGSRKAR